MQKKLKVLHISNYLKKGGAETVFRITSSNPEAENLVGYFSDNKNDAEPDIKFSSWESNSKLSGIINYIFSFKNYFALSAFLAKNKIDIIHIQGFFSSLSPSILLAIKKHITKGGLKVFQTLHEFHLICPNASLYNFRTNQICEKCVGHNFKYFVFFSNCDRRGLLYSIIKGIRSIISNNIINHKSVVNKFIVPSEFLLNKLLEDGLQREKIVLVRNPIQISFSNSKKAKKNIIAYFGRFSFEKDIPFLIDAFSNWKLNGNNAFKLLLIGEGEELKKIETAVANSIFSGDIILKPFMPINKLEEELETVKYFSLTSSCYENSPMTILEAAALRIIPIVPSIGGMNESVEKIVKIGATYSPKSIDSWCNTLNKLESNYEDEFKKFDSLDLEMSKSFSIKSYFESINRLYRN